MIPSPLQDEARFGVWGDVISKSQILATSFPPTPVWPTRKAFMIQKQYVSIAFIPPYHLYVPNTHYHFLSSQQDTNFRRTWDRDEYERKARERARADRQKEDDEERKLKGLPPKSRPNRVNPPRDLLKAREEKVVLDANLNKTQVVQSAAGVASKTPGYYCKVCDCTVKDSVNYLDHINGKKRE